MLNGTSSVVCHTKSSIWKRNVIMCHTKIIMNIKFHLYQTHLQEKIKNANKTYFMLQNFFKNKNISIYPSGFITAVAVFRKPNAIPLCFSIDLFLNFLLSWLLECKPWDAIGITKVCTLISTIFCKPDDSRIRPKHVAN